jgi:hypothetical protein
MATQKGIITSQNLPRSGRTFLVHDESGPPCYRDPWGDWACGHEHADPVPLEDAYQYFEGWTAQMRL